MFGDKHDHICCDCNQPFTTGSWSKKQRCPACRKAHNTLRLRQYRRATGKPLGRPLLKPVATKERERQMRIHINRMAGHAKCPLCGAHISATRDCNCPNFTRAI